MRNLFLGTAVAGLVSGSVEIAEQAEFLNVEDNKPSDSSAGSFLAHSEASEGGEAQGDAQESNAEAVEAEASDGAEKAEEGASQANSAQSEPQENTDGDEGSSKMERWERKVIRRKKGGHKVADHKAANGKKKALVNDAEAVSSGEGHTEADAAMMDDVAAADKKIVAADKKLDIIDKEVGAAKNKKVMDAEIADVNVADVSDATVVEEPVAMAKGVPPGAVGAKMAGAMAADGIVSEASDMPDGLGPKKMMKMGAMAKKKMLLGAKAKGMAGGLAAKKQMMAANAAGMPLEADAIAAEAAASEGVAVAPGMDGAAEVVEGAAPADVVIMEEMPVDPAMAAADPKVGAKMAMMGAGAMPAAGGMGMVPGAVPEEGMMPAKMAMAPGVVGKKAMAAKMALAGAKMAGVPVTAPGPLGVSDAPEGSDVPADVIEVVEPAAALATTAQEAALESGQPDGMVGVPPGENG